MIGARRRNLRRGILNEVTRAIAPQSIRRFCKTVIKRGENIGSARHQRRERSIELSLYSADQKGREQTQLTGDVRESRGLREGAVISKSDARDQVEQYVRCVFFSGFEPQIAAGLKNLVTA